MTALNWIPLNVDSLRRVTQGDSGERRKAAIYDVPVAFVVEEHDGRAELRFQYVINDEPTDEVPLTDAVTITVGKHSRRLYRISVLRDVKNSEPWEDLLGGLKTALDLPKNRKLYHDREENFSIVERVVRDQRSPVSSASKSRLAHAG